MPSHKDPARRARVLRAVSLFAEGYEPALLGKVYGVHPKTISEWVRRYSEGPRNGDGPQCDLCEILLGQDALKHEGGLELHPATPTTETRCWMCRLDYGDRPAEEILISS